MNLTKDILIDAIIGGTNIPQGGYGNLTEFCGNQWNENWKWKHDELNKIDFDKLFQLYKILK